ncbi:hypothetical protein [Mucilaginibacter limnophilus]|nr:hypothetical protein [Mucilaginibacter limnophilus]
MKLSGLLLFCISFLFASCNSPKKDLSDNVDWTYLQITSESNWQITIVNGSAFSRLVNLHHRYALSSDTSYVKPDTTRLKFSNDERDSIYYLVNSLIERPAQTDKFCTEFVGKLKLSVFYGEQLERTCNYSSVCNWSRMSDETDKLYKILKRHIPQLSAGTD